MRQHTTRKITLLRNPSWRSECITSEETVARDGNAVITTDLVAVHVGGFAMVLNAITAIHSGEDLPDRVVSVVGKCVLVRSPKSHYVPRADLLRRGIELLYAQHAEAVARVAGEETETRRNRRRRRRCRPRQPLRPSAIPSPMRIVRQNTSGSSRLCLSHHLSTHGAQARRSMSLSARFIWRTTSGSCASGSTKTRCAKQRWGMCVPTASGRNRRTTENKRSCILVTGNAGDSLFASDGPSHAVAIESALAAAQKP